MNFDTTMSDATYVAERAEAAAELLSTMKWEKGSISGTLRCVLYGHSIVWDINKNTLHAGGWCMFEVLPSGKDDIECFECLEALLAWILRRNW